MHQHKRKGLLMKLDFYHASNRLSLDNVDKALEAMTVSSTLGEVIKTLHQGPWPPFSSISL
jgi:hypothetical protein